MPPGSRSRPRPSPPVVALLSDFGFEGHHAGVLRAVLARINPQAHLLDLCHGIPPTDVVAGAWTLRWGWRYFPEGTVHLAVVDPGVGTARRALAARAGGQYFVGPDNGLLSLALQDAGDALVVSLRPRLAVAPAPTFHGRDVLAPAAARLSLGQPLARQGRRIDDWVRLDAALAHRPGPGRLEGQVIAVDRWGNLVTSVTDADLAGEGIGPDATVRVSGRSLLGICRTYADAAPGAPLALINSNGHLEVAVHGGRATDLLRARRGALVRVLAGRPGASSTATGPRPGAPAQK